MTDWLEEVLKLAEGEERGTEGLLSSLTLISGGAFRPRWRAVGGESPAEAEAAFSPEDSRRALLSQRLWAQAYLPGGGVLRELARRAAGEAPALGAAPGGGEGSGLGLLYRRAGEAVRSPYVPAPLRSEGAAVPEGFTPAAGLTVQELDRAVRRDSRRYDGGMSIY